MSAAVKIVQWIVGLLFIASGLVKANDPVGLSYKMQEFFELWSASFAAGSSLANALFFLHNISLGLSVFMITLEVFAGVALLLGWMKKAILWLLLLLILFFTFLTGYAYLSGKFTNCGCFGDCLPITPLTSFLKDIALLLMILFLLFARRYIQPFLSTGTRTQLLTATLVFSLGLQWYVLNYLPLKDCLPFKVGNNLPTQMKPLPGAVPDSFAIRFVYEKGGKQFEFAPENLPADFNTYKFIDRKQTLVRKGNADAAIKGFSLTAASIDSVTGNVIDSTGIVLSQPKAILLFAMDFSKPNWMEETKPLLNNAAQNAVPVYIISPNRTEAQTAFAKTGVQSVQFFDTDFTVVRTVARTNPTILFLEEGNVVKKWAGKELRQAAEYVTTAKR